jgi:hypothetical protein
VSNIESAAAKASRPTIHDLQAAHSHAINELDELVRALGAKIDPVRVRREVPAPMSADVSTADNSTVGAVIIGQTSTVRDITDYVRVVLSEIEF